MGLRDSLENGLAFSHKWLHKSINDTIKNCKVNNFKGVNINYKLLDIQVFGHVKTIPQCPMFNHKD